MQVQEDRDPELSWCRSTRSTTRSCLVVDQQGKILLILFCVILKDTILYFGLFPWLENAAECSCSFSLNMIKQVCTAEQLTYFYIALKDRNIRLVSIKYTDMSDNLSSCGNWHSLFSEMNCIFHETTCSISSTYRKNGCLTYNTGGLFSIVTECWCNYLFRMIGRKEHMYGYKSDSWVKYFAICYMYLHCPWY